MEKIKINEDDLYYAIYSNLRQFVDQKQMNVKDMIKICDDIVNCFKSNNTRNLLIDVEKFQNIIFFTINDIGKIFLCDIKKINDSIVVDVKLKKL